MALCCRAYGNLEAVAQPSALSVGLRLPRDSGCYFARSAVPEHRVFCKRILPAIPPIIDVETMNEFDARCHHLFPVTNALENHRCIACGHDRPVLEPLAIASSLSICPSCDEALQQELRNAPSRENQTCSFPQCVALTALGIRVLHMFLWWAPGNSRLVFRYVVRTKTICCCIADACAYRTLTAMARVPVRAA